MSTLKERVVSYSSHVHNKLKVCIKKVGSLGGIWVIESGLRELLRKIIHISLAYSKVLKVSSLNQQHQHHLGTL